MVVQCNVSNTAAEPNYDLFPLHIPEQKLLLGMGSFIVLNGAGFTDYNLRTPQDKIIAKIVSYDETQTTIF